MIGSNGIGKSNLLESVELFGSLKSHRVRNDKDLISWNEDKAVLQANTNENDVLAIELNKSGGRKAYRNGKLLVRQIDLIGPLRSVGFSSLDLHLVRGEPALRRTWLDGVVQQLEPIYRDLISRFNKLLRQRNQLWKHFKNSPTQERNDLLDIFDAQMALISTRIHRRRKRALKHIQPLAASWHERLSKGKEVLEIHYVPGSILEDIEEEITWKVSIEKQLISQRNEEERLGICKVGPHRDEINFLLNGFETRRFASSGQQRTLVVALKLAELELMHQLYGVAPILLLDDVLAELDQTRQLLLLEAVGNTHQCLISATHLDSFESNWQKQSQIVNLESSSQI